MVAQLTAARHGPAVFGLERCAVDFEGPLEDPEVHRELLPALRNRPRRVPHPCVLRQTPLLLSGNDRPASTVSVRSHRNHRVVDVPPQHHAAFPRRERPIQRREVRCPALEIVVEVDQTSEDALTRSEVGALVPLQAKKQRTTLRSARGRTRRK